MGITFSVCQFIHLSVTLCFWWCHMRYGRLVWFMFAFSNHFADSTMDADMDLGLVRRDTQTLSSDAAKHRISVKPKARRSSSMMNRSRTTTREVSVWHDKLAIQRVIQISCSQLQNVLKIVFTYLSKFLGICHYLLLVSSTFYTKSPSWLQVAGDPSIGLTSFVFVASPSVCPVCHSLL